MKRKLLAASIFLVLLLTQAGIRPNVSLSAEIAKKADLLFVHNANHITVADGKLILKGISPTVLFFTDRPYLTPDFDGRAPLGQKRSGDTRVGHRSH